MNHSETPPIIVSFFLTGVFAMTCRWIKRNPSSFLRYALFPFGGLNVERWPKFMLVMVRICASLAFFFLFLAFVDLLAPGTVGQPSPAVLYSKFAFCIVVSIFALRGTGEPMFRRGKPVPGRPCSLLRRQAGRAVEVYHRLTDTEREEVAEIHDPSILDLLQ